MSRVTDVDTPRLGGGYPAHRYHRAYRGPLPEKLMSSRELSSRHQEHHASAPADRDTIYLFVCWVSAAA